MKAQPTLLERVLPQKLEKFLSVALTKLKNIWMQESARNGIQFYIEAEE